MAQLAAFLGISALVIVTPGQDTALTIRNTLFGGRRADDSLPTEWQVYRLFDARRGAWSTFQFLIRERLLEEGVDVGSDGELA